MNRILKDIGNFIFVEDSPEPADAILIAGGSFPELPEYAAELWKQGLAPVIFIGGGVSIKTGKFPGPASRQEIYSSEYPTEYDFYQDVLLKNGVPQEAILGENRSGYTRQNALFAKETADKKGLRLRKALLVSKASHARRCLLFYQSAFPETRFLSLPVVCENISRENWFETEAGVSKVLGELTRCGNQIDFSDIEKYKKL